MGKKIVLVSSSVIGLIVAAVYYTYFYHAAAADILAAQQNIGSVGRLKLNPHGVYNISEIASTIWRKWMADRGYVSMGDIYDSCDPADRVMIGQSAMLADKEYGGLNSITYVNTSLDETITGGVLALDVSFNGRNLYSTEVNLCTAEASENPSDRIIVCPIRKGTHRWKKMIKIPNFIANGAYDVIAKLKNTKGEVKMCAISKFKI